MRKFIQLNQFYIMVKMFKIYFIYPNSSVTNTSFHISLYLALMYKERSSQIYPIKCDAIIRPPKATQPLHFYPAFIFSRFPSYFEQTSGGLD